MVHSHMPYFAVTNDSLLQICNETVLKAWLPAAVRQIAGNKPALRLNDDMIGHSRVGISYIW